MFWKHDQRGWLRYYGVGMEFTLTFLMGLGGGYWLDQVHGPQPAYTLSLGALGFAVALYRILRQADEIRRSDRQEQDGT